MVLNLWKVSVEEEVGEGLKEPHHDRTRPDLIFHSRPTPWGWLVKEDLGQNQPAMRDNPEPLTKA